MQRTHLPRACAAALVSSARQPLAALAHPAAAARASTATCAPSPVAAAAAAVARAAATFNAQSSSTHPLHSRTMTTTALSLTLTPDDVRKRAQEILHKYHTPENKALHAQLAELLDEIKLPFVLQKGGLQYLIPFIGYEEKLALYAYLIEELEAITKLRDSERRLESIQASFNSIESRLVEVLSWFATIERHLNEKKSLLSQDSVVALIPEKNETFSITPEQVKVYLDCAEDLVRDVRIEIGQATLPPESTKLEADFFDYEVRLWKTKFSEICTAYTQDPSTANFIKLKSLLLLINNDDLPQNPKHPIEPPHFQLKAQRIIATL